MSEVFLKLVNMSISAAWLVLAVVVLRLFLKKAPKWIPVLLWGIVAVRLLCPISIESVLSLIPSSETIPLDIGLDTTPAIHSGIPVLNSVINPMIQHSNTPSAGDSVNPLQITLAVAANIWVLGAAAMLLYTAVSYLRLRKKLTTATLLRRDVYQSETVSSPFVLGLIKPRIYLPYNIASGDLTHVLAHEQAHIRRKDHWWKPLGFLLLALHWFNPLMWVAYILLCRDIELACDEKVIASLENGQRGDYTQALVSCSVRRFHVAACPLAFGEVGVKDRVKSIMNYRKPAFWIVVTAVAVCAVVAVCFLTNPPDSTDYLMLVEWSDYSEESDQIIYEINLGNQTVSGEVYVEEWSKGTCVRSAPLMISRFDDSIEITIHKRKNGNTVVGTDIQIQTNQDRGHLSTQLTYPEGLFDFGYYPSRTEQNKKITLSPGKEIILEARSYGVLYHWWPHNSETFINYPSFIENAEYMILIRAVFHENAPGAKGEEPLTDSGTVLQAKILEIHDGNFLVEPVAGSRELNSADRIEVPMRNMRPSPEPGVGDILQIEYDGLIQETYPARISNVHHIRVVQQAQTAPKSMIPTDTDLKGLHAGALLLPIDGKTYRYLLTDRGADGIAVGEEIYSFTEPGIHKNIDWVVYSLKDYPDLSVVLLASQTDGAWLCQYSPPGRCSDTALEDAISAGYAVMEDGIATHGRDVWKAFYDATRQGNTASITVAHYHTLDEERCDTAYCEAFRQDYPYLSVYHLNYDGRIYTLSFTDGDEAHTRTYEYLMAYSDLGSPISSQLPSLRYVLTHDDKVTWEQLFRGMTSSQAGAYIDHFTVYVEKQG